MPGSGAPAFRDADVPGWFFEKGKTFSKKPLTQMAVMLIYSSHFYGALAQLGERMAGSHEVRGSIPLGSTIETSDQDIVPGLFIFCSNGVRGGSSSLDFLRTGVLFTLPVEGS